MAKIEYAKIRVLRQNYVKGNRMGFIIFEERNVYLTPTLRLGY